MDALEADLLIVTIGGAVSLLMVGLAMRATARDATLNRRMAGIAAPTPVHDGVVPLRWPEIMLLCLGKDRMEVTQALRAADITHPQGVLIFAALRFAATLAAGLGTAFLLSPLQGISLLFPFAAAGGAFIGAKIALRSRTGARRRRLGKELPFALDIMLLMLESGVSLDQCFRHLAQSDARAVPAVQRVLTVLVDDLQKGMAYEVALERWADRMNVRGARELASLFRQTILHGTELAPALRAFNQELSEKRISGAREVIGKKTTQMTVVMIFFLMPALMIVIMGPAIVAVFGALKTMNP